jgi:hypothetical protein
MKYTDDHMFNIQIRVSLSDRGHYMSLPGPISYLQLIYFMEDSITYKSTLHTDTYIFIECLLASLCVEF